MKKDYVDILNRENITLASLNKRAFAFLIDELLLSVLVFFMISNKIDETMNYQEIMVVSSSIVFYVISIKAIYQTIFVYLYGATIGKIAMSIHIVNIDDLEKPNLFLSAVRSTGRVINETILLYIGFLLFFIDPVKQTLHDKIAKTIVIDV
jgi:uncharacterized RDD family membrane protein YckC